MYAERPSRIPGSTVWTTVSDGRPARILPDGCMDLIWTGGRLVVAGPDTRAFLSRTPQGERVIGVRLAPGLAPSVLEMPAALLRNQRVELAAAWGDRAAARWESRVAESPTPAGLETLILQHLRRTEQNPTQHARTVELLSRGTAISAIADEFNVSERQLHRRSLAAFGYAPKVLAGILRFRRALAAARSGEPLAQAAFDAGYADQSHLARQAKALAGVPITALL